MNARVHAVRFAPKRFALLDRLVPNRTDYFGNTDPTFHALVGDGQRGADGIQGLKCQACGTRFSSRRGTALYRLRTPAAQVAQALLVINLGLSIADTALLFHHSEVTLRLWLSRAGQHAEQVHTHFFQNLTLGHVQLDETNCTLTSNGGAPITISVVRTCPCGFGSVCRNCDGASRPHVVIRRAPRLWPLALRTTSGRWKSC